MLVSTPVLPASATEEKASLCSIFFSSSSFPSLSLSRFLFRTHAACKVVAVFNRGRPHARARQRITVRNYYDYTAQATVIHGHYTCEEFEKIMVADTEQICACHVAFEWPSRRT